MIADNDQFELLCELEVVLTHEIGADFFASGNGLDATLVPAATLFRFEHQDEAGGPELGKFREMSRAGG